MPDYGGILRAGEQSTDIFQLLHDKFDTVFEMRSKYRKMLLEHDVKSVPLFAIIVLRITVGPKLHSPIIFVKKIDFHAYPAPRHFHPDLCNVRR